MTKVWTPEEVIAHNEMSLVKMEKLADDIRTFYPHGDVRVSESSSTSVEGLKHFYVSLYFESGLVTTFGGQHDFQNFRKFVDSCIAIGVNSVLETELS